MSEMPKTFSNQLRNIRTTVTTGGKSRFRRRFLKMHPRDQAEYLLRQKQNVRDRLYEFLTPAELADLLEHLHLRQRVDFFLELPVKRAAQVLSSMYVDDVVDILQRLRRKRSEGYIELIEDELIQDVRELLHYRQKTAGSLMTTEFASVKVGQTVGEAVVSLRAQAERVVTIYYVFVLDDSEKLIKVVSLKELLIANKASFVDELGRDKVVSVNVNSTDVEVAHAMRDYNFLALPVVDDNGRMRGVITIDDVVDVIDELAADRYSSFAGVRDIELRDGPFLSARKRLPWLILLLFLGMITATLIGYFEATIAQVAILGAFIPVVAGTTGNSGTQSLAIVIRGVASGELKALSLKRYFAKEVVTAFVTSLVCGVVLLGIVYFWKQDIYIGIVTGVSLALSIFAGTIVGSAIPLVLRKLRVDPAVASGPLITTICDIISMGIYFGIATLLLVHLM